MMRNATVSLVINMTTLLFKEIESKISTQLLHVIQGRHWKALRVSIKASCFLVQHVKKSSPYDRTKFILFSDICTENHLEHVGSLAKRAVCTTD